MFPGVDMSRVFTPPPRPPRVLTRLEQLGKVIASVRKERGWNQAQLGQRARPRAPISHTTISKIENGDSDPQFKTLDDICVALGTTLSVVLASIEGEPLAVSPRHRQHLISRTAHDLHEHFEQLIGAAVDTWQKLVVEQQ